MPSMRLPKMGDALHNYNHIPFQGTSLCLNCENRFMDDELIDGRCVMCNAEWNEEEDRISIERVAKQTQAMAEEREVDIENAREDLELMA